MPHTGEEVKEKIENRLRRACTRTRAREGAVHTAGDADILFGGEDTLHPYREPYSLIVTLHKYAEHALEERLQNVQYRRKS